MLQYYYHIFRSYSFYKLQIVKTQPDNLDMCHKWVFVLLLIKFFNFYSIGKHSISYRNQTERFNHPKFKPYHSFFCAASVVFVFF